MKTKASKWSVFIIGLVFGIYRYQIPVPGLQMFQQTIRWDRRLNGVRPSVRPSLNFPVASVPGPLDGLRCLGFDTCQSGTKLQCSKSKFEPSNLPVDVERDEWVADQKQSNGPSYHRGPRTIHMGQPILLY